MSLNYAKIIKPKIKVKKEENNRDEKDNEQYILPPHISIGKEMSYDIWLNKYEEDITDIYDIYCSRLVRLYPELYDTFMSKKFILKFSRFLYDKSSGRYLKV